MFRSWDRAKAGQVTRFVANSRAVAERIGRFYGREAQVVHPPVRTDFLTPAGERGETFLYVGSLVSYKRADLVVEAFRELPYRLTVVGEGHLGRALKAARRRKRHLPRRGGRRRATRALSRAARALVFPANEDFGITMAEAQACGTPVIALAEGGAADIVAHGETGWLLPDQSLPALRQAIRAAAAQELETAAIRARGAVLGATLPARAQRSRRRDSRRRSERALADRCETEYCFRGRSLL